MFFLLQLCWLLSYDNVLTFTQEKFQMSPLLVLPPSSRTWQLIFPKETTTFFKKVNKYWNTKNSFYLVTSGGQNSSTYLIAFHFINTI